MGSLEAQMNEFIPALRRYARVIVLNTIVADQLVKESLEETYQQLNEKVPENLKLRLFHALSRKICHKNFDRNGVRDLTADALRDLLGDHNRHDAESQDLVAGLTQLSQQQREVLILASMEGFKYKEIGLMVDEPLVTVMNRLHSAREQMRESLFGA